MEGIIDSKYNLTQRIGKGSFGDIFEAKELKSNRKVALKLQRLGTTEHSFIKETEILKIFHGFHGFPRLVSHGKHDSRLYITMDLCEESLQSRFEAMGKKMNLLEVSLTGIQTLKRIETMHKMKLIHRDIKPHNFLMKKKTIKIIDFGTSNIYYENNRHILFQNKSSFVGNYLFCSKNAHNRHTLSRRDDLESWCYMISYLSRGYLPWYRSEGHSDGEHFFSIYKSNLNSSQLFKLEEFKHIFSYISSLEFDQTPNYSYIKQKLRAVAKANIFMNSNIFSNQEKISSPSIINEEILTVEDKNLPKLKTRRSQMSDSKTVIVK